MKYYLKFDMMDGTWTREFATLEETVATLREHYLGSDYIRSGFLQTEYGMIALGGFTWQDIGVFSYADGYPEFRFYTDFGGDAVDLRKGPYLLVEHIDMDERSDSRVLGAFPTLEDARRAYAAVEWDGLAIEKDGESLCYYDPDEMQWVDIQQSDTHVAESVIKEQPPF